MWLSLLPSHPSRFAAEDLTFMDVSEHPEHSEFADCDPGIISMSHSKQ
jgi:hypothetical protein